MATDLVSAEQVVRSSGDAIDCILESINLPLLSPPICKDGMALVDGGILNNLPADVLLRQDCSFIVGSNVSSCLDAEFMGNTPDTPTDQMKTPGDAATLARCFSVQAYNMSAIGAASADIMIHSDVASFDPADFTKTPQLADVGQPAAEDLIPDIKAMLSRLDPELFPD